MFDLRILSLSILITLLVSACTPSVTQDQPSLAATLAPSVAQDQTSVATTLAPSAEPPKPAATAKAPILPIMGPAPEWQNQVWVNSDEPLLLADLQGKVVLLEFWTFG